MTGYVSESMNDRDVDQALDDINAKADGDMNGEEKKGNPMQMAAQNALKDQKMQRLEQQMETASAMLQDHENRLVKATH